jgi:cytochrome c oxidase cbb3-type subunit I/II
MPPYAFLASSKLDFGKTATKVKAMKTLGVPYTDGDVAGAKDSASAAAEKIAAGLARETGQDVAPDSQMTALIAYLQRLGRVPEAPQAAAVTPVVPVGGG